MENNTNNKPNESASPERKELQSPNTNSPANNTEGSKGASTAVKALAVLGIVALLLLGLYGTSRVVANLPEAARSIAAGFVSVTSQFFGADEDEEEDDNEVAVTEDEEDEEDEDEDASRDDEEEDEEDEDETASTPTGNTGGETTTTRSEYRIVHRPVTTTGTTVSDPNGDTDLELTILATGVLDRSRDREFVERDEVDSNDTVAVKFQVKNIGTKTSEEWWYRAELPTDSGFTYDSEEQLELKPGERMEFVLAFTDIEDNGGTAEVEIEIDPSRDLDESSRSNNRETVEIDVD